MYFVYIIKSEKDHGYYVGITEDINNRLNYHNTGKVRSTKSRVPFKVIYTEEYSDRIQAREREKFLKSYKGAGEKAKIFKNYNK